MHSNTGKQWQETKEYMAIMRKKIFILLVSVCLVISSNQAWNTELAALRKKVNLCSKSCNVCVETLERQTFLPVVLGKQKNNSNKDQEGSGRSNLVVHFPEPGREGTGSRGGRRAALPGHGAGQGPRICPPVHPFRSRRHAGRGLHS